MEDQEKFYDDEIAPSLRILMERCKERGMSFIATVQFADGGVGSIGYAQPNGHAMLRMAFFACRSKGNVDDLILQLQKDGKEHGHNSIFLDMLARAST